MVTTGSESFNIKVWLIMRYYRNPGNRPGAIQNWHIYKNGFVSKNLQAQNVTNILKYDLQSLFGSNSSKIRLEKKPLLKINIQSIWKTLLYNLLFRKVICLNPKPKLTLILRQFQI